MEFNFNRKQKKRILNFIKNSFFIIHDRTKAIHEEGLYKFEMYIQDDFPDSGEIYLTIKKHDEFVNLVYQDGDISNFVLEQLSY